MSDRLFATWQIKQIRSDLPGAVGHGRAFAHVRPGWNCVSGTDAQLLTRISLPTAKSKKSENMENR